MVGMLDKLGSSATATSVEKGGASAPLKFDAQLLDLTYSETQKHWRFSEILNLRANAGATSALYAEGTDWGKIITFVERLQAVFSLPPETVFCSVWRDASTNETRRVLPSIRKAGDKPVLAMPKALDPLPLEKFSVIGNDTNVSGLIIPFSLNIALIREEFECEDDDDAFKDTMKYTIQPLLAEGELRYVREFVPSYLRFDPSLGAGEKTLASDEPDDMAGVNARYVKCLRSVFSLTDEVIHSSWKNKEGETLHTFPSIRRHENTLVLSLPKSPNPIAIPPSSYRFKGATLVFNDEIEIPIALDWDLLPDSESRERATKEIVQGKYNFVKEWKAPGSGFTQLKTLDPGIYFANSIEITSIEGVKKADGKKFKAKKAEIVMCGLDEPSFQKVDGTENNGAALLRELRSESTKPQFYEFYQSGDVITDKKMAFSKAFILLFLSKVKNDRGVTVSLAVINPYCLRDKAVSPILTKFLDQNGHTCESLYSVWSERHTGGDPGFVEATVEEVVQPSLTPVQAAPVAEPVIEVKAESVSSDRAFLMQRSDELMKDKALAKKAILEFCTQSFGVKTRQKMTDEQLSAFIEWLETKETPVF